MLFKPTLREGYRSIVKKSLGEKKSMMIYTDSKTAPVEEVPVPVDMRSQFALTENEII
jgi:pyruvate,water dikinase